MTVLPLLDCVISSFRSTKYQRNTRPVCLDFRFHSIHNGKTPNERLRSGACLFSNWFYFNPSLAFLVSVVLKRHIVKTAVRESIGKS